MLKYQAMLEVKEEKIRQKEILSWTILVLCSIAFIILFVKLFLGEVENIAVILIGLFTNGFAISFWAFLLIKLEDDKPITVDRLDKLECVGREQDGSYSDRWSISIIPDAIKNRWVFATFNEVDGSTTFIRYVKTMGELRTIYSTTTNENLE